MKILTEENLDVVNDHYAREYYMECKSTTAIDHLAVNSCFGIYCSSKKSKVLKELLKERSQLLKRLKDEKASTYVLEKLFKDFNFYRPFDVLTNYSNEAYEALQMCNVKKARLYLTKLINGVREYGAEVGKDELQEFEHRIGNFMNEQLGLNFKFLLLFRDFKSPNWIRDPVDE